MTETFWLLNCLKPEAPKSLRYAPKLTRSGIPSSRLFFCQVNLPPMEVGRAFLARQPMLKKPRGFHFNPRSASIPVPAAPAIAPEFKEKVWTKYFRFKPSAKTGLNLRL